MLLLFVLKGFIYLFIQLSIYPFILHPFFDAFIPYLLDTCSGPGTVLDIGRMSVRRHIVSSLESLYTRQEYR